MKHRGLLSVLRLVALTVVVGLSASYGVYGYQLTMYEGGHSRGIYGYAGYSPMLTNSTQYAKYSHYRLSVVEDNGQSSHYDYRGRSAHHLKTGVYARIDYTHAYSNGWGYGESSRYARDSYKRGTASGWNNYTANLFQPVAYRFSYS
jgi:hypothetical protein